MKRQKRKNKNRKLAGGGLFVKNKIWTSDGWLKILKTKKDVNFMKNIIKVGDDVIVERGNLPPYFGKLKSIIKQGWYEYGEIETYDGEIKAWDSDVHRLIKL